MLGKTEGECAVTLFKRRNFLGALAAGGAAAASAQAAAQAVGRDVDPAKLAKDSDIACLYHCDFGDNGRYDAMLRNMANHLSVYDANPFALKLVSVHHAAGIRFHLKTLEGTPWAANPPDPEFEKRVDGLAQAGVEVYLCKITFQRFNLSLDRAKDAPYIKFVPSGVATVAELQAKGFAYLKVG
jgi:uncharacterized protein